ncbi:AAA-like domain-containing protein [Nostoc sp. GT001]|uniref:AAA-like domain-containing protein n=1 Tax=Nostoc sp. GT001 TaxID=3056647 RepID=UPI0025AA3BE4|nr:AAA-like domain-containing protein [Nostoc sp. GT001]MDM9580126.1 AAA-like domain-containing protein [Nostoc sp. GT001]
MLINQENFEKIYQDELTPKQKKVLPLFLAGQTDEQIAKELGATHRSTASHQLRNISTKFGFPPETEPDYRCNLIEMFAKYKPELVSAKVLEKCGYIIQNIRFPDGPEPLNSAFYQERSPIESRCYTAIKEPGGLIRIKAPKQMGKTSLLKRIIAEAKKSSYNIVYLNFSLIEKNKFTNANDFLRSFYAYVINQLPSAPSLSVWDKDTPSMVNCTLTFYRLLKQLDGVLVLALDEVDKLFEYPEIYENFFPMLRNWNENANESETWEKLRLVVAHSTEDYGRLDINQSPFNIGLPIKLEEFTEEQVKSLAIRHGLDSKNILPIMSLVGGHPYLVRLALYYLVCQDVTIEGLLKEATRDTGIYTEHLRRHLETLQENQELGRVFQEIVSNTQGIKVERKNRQLYQLDSMGVIKFSNNFVMSRCRLYYEYFGVGVARRRHCL